MLATDMRGNMYFRLNSWASLPPGMMHPTTGGHWLLWIPLLFGFHVPDPVTLAGVKPTNLLIHSKDHQEATHSWKKACKEHFYFNCKDGIQSWMQESCYFLIILLSQTCMLCTVEMSSLQKLWQPWGSLDSSHSC